MQAVPSAVAASIRRAALLAASAWLAGCASAPAPRTPPDAVAALPTASFLERDPDASAFDESWWQRLGDPQLAALVAEAQRANPDLRIAVARVGEARAGSTAAASRLAPTVSLTGSASNERTGLSDRAKQGVPDVRALRVALDLDWEIDLFGAARAAADAAQLDADAAADGADAARLLAAGETARQYLVWQGARLRLAKLDELLAAQADTERLVRRREAEGQASRFDVARASAETQALAAQLPPLRAQAAAAAHQTAVLLGRSPSTPLPALDAARAPALPEMPALHPGQPAELLARRPDLRAAERRLAAASARLQEARADRLPRVLLAAVFGRQDLELNAIDLASALYGNVALAFALPLFNAGRLQAAEDRAAAREDAASVEYERAVLGALRDVESSLALLARERERAPPLLAQLAERRAAVGHAQSLRREGQIDLLQLLDVQRGLIGAELALVEHRTQLALDAVQLYRALGGGWTLDDDTRSSR